MSKSLIPQQGIFSCFAYTIAYPLWDRGGTPISVVNIYHITQENNALHRESVNGTGHEMYCLVWSDIRRFCLVALNLFLKIEN